MRPHNHIDEYGVARHADGRQAFISQFPQGATFIDYREPRAVIWGDDILHDREMLKKGIVLKSSFDLVHG